LWGDDDELAGSLPSSNFDWLDDASQSSLSGAAVAVASSRTLQLPIEHIPLGARVPTKNPKPWERDNSLPEPDEATWVVVSLAVERSDGGIVDAELMRPRVWVEQHGIEAGKLLPLNIEELQVSGLAFVNSVQPAPRIAGGEGSIVTARFVTRQVDLIARIEVQAADGQVETIEGTTIHPIWSLDRKDWVPLGEIEEGEQLLGADGAVVILTHTVLQRSIPVYNIEVHGEHVYQVGELRLLVHNTCAGYNSAMTQALGWLGNHGFDLTRAISYASRSSVTFMKGIRNGLKDGKIGYRIEWDPKIGGHINVFAGKVIGPHFRFSGNPADVAALLRQLF